MGKPDFKVTPDVGKKILEWCNEPKESASENIDNEILQRINSCKTLEELLEIYKVNPQIQESMLPHFTKKRQLLTVKNDLKNIINNQNISQNGTTNNQ